MSSGQQDGTPNENGSVTLVRDPYGILKVDRDASNDDIQRSFKLLSRTFHPDKQPPGPSREAAQEVFVAFKNAHEILTDPVLRASYDHHGHEGVRFLKRSVNSTEPDALYPKLSRLYQLGYAEEAQSHLQEALQALDFERSEADVRISATLEFPCTTQSTRFLGEGREPMSVPELMEARMSFSVSSNRPAEENRWDVTVGGSSNWDAKGQADASGQVSVAYKPVQGTDITADLDVGNPFRFAIGTSRALSNRTLVTTTIRTIPKSKNLSLSGATHRSLFQNTMRGTVAAGMGTDRVFHYGLISFTTLSTRFPQITTKLNYGMDAYPLRVSARHTLSSGHVGEASYGWGPMGIEVRALLSRVLTAYATFTIGVRHATQTGLTWLFQMERGDIKFRIPITLSSVASPGYDYKLVWISAMSLLIDQMIGEFVQDKVAILLEKQDKDKLERESSLQQIVKTKQDAEQQVELMQKTAETCRQRELKSNGLVIRKATYYVEGGEAMDATLQLQFMVNNSQLSLPATPKSHLLGFYNLKSGGTVPIEPSGWISWLRYTMPWSSSTANAALRPPAPSTPQLKVRYECGGYVYEVSISDEEELELPGHARALCLGNSDIVLQ